MKRNRRPELRSARLGITMLEIREATIERDILTYLRWRRIPAWPTHSTRNYCETPGMADILGVLEGGRLLAIEVKSEEGIVSKAQREWLNQVHLCGGLVVVARCIEDVQRAIDCAIDESRILWGDPRKRQPLGVLKVQRAIDGA